MEEVGPTFTVSVACGEAFILCHVCGRRSFHPEDIANLYCRFCHKFHVTPIEELLGDITGAATS
jgi:hypothetical protein